MSTDDRRRQLRLLAQDIADLSPSLLARAAEHWVKTSSFMPKAADLRLLVKNIAEREPGGQKRLDQAARANARLDSENPSFGFRWIQTETECKLHPISELQRVGTTWRLKPPPPRVTAEQIDAIMAEYGIPPSSTLGKLAGKSRPAHRMPSESDYAEMGVTIKRDAAE